MVKAEMKMRGVIVVAYRVRGVLHRRDHSCHVRVRVRLAVFADIALTGCRHTVTECRQTADKISLGLHGIVTEIDAAFLLRVSVRGAKPISPISSFRPCATSSVVISSEGIRGNP
jgi:hypothetical protein